MYEVQGTLTCPHPPTPPHPKIAIFKNVRFTSASAGKNMYVICIYVHTQNYIQCKCISYVYANRIGKVWRSGTSHKTPCIPVAREKSVADVKGMRTSYKPPGKQRTAVQGSFLAKYRPFWYNSLCSWMSNQLSDGSVAYFADFWPTIPEIRSQTIKSTARFSKRIHCSRVASQQDMKISPGAIWVFRPAWTCLWSRQIRSVGVQRGATAHLV